MSEWRIETSIPAETRAERRERIAVQMLAGLLACPDVHGSPAGLAKDAIEFANALMAELDKAAAEDAKEEGK